MYLLNFVKSYTLFSSLNPFTNFRSARIPTQLCTVNIKSQYEHGMFGFTCNQSTCEYVYCCIEPTLTLYTWINSDEKVGALRPLITYGITFQVMTYCPMDYKENAFWTNIKHFFLWKCTFKTLPAKAFKRSLQSLFDSSRATGQHRVFLSLLLPIKISQSVQWYKLLV